MRVFRFAAVSLAVCAAVALAGCGSGPKRYKVSGNVTYKGTPIPAGSITFLSDSGGAVGGAPIKDGKYEVPAEAGLPAGKYKVSISYPDPKGAAASKEGEAPGVGDKGGAGGDGVDPRSVKELIPAKYNQKTELSIEVKDGEANNFPFDLK